MDAYAQSRGQDLSGAPCAARGATGCGGCYPEPVPPSDPIAAALAQLNLVNPEWQPIGPMIPGGDTSLPPDSVPVRINATVALSKSPGDDFPSTHITSDYNAELIPDDNGRLATGDDDKRLEFEWEGDKLPMYMWSGEGDRLDRRRPLDLRLRPRRPRPAGQVLERRRSLQCRWRLSQRRHVHQSGADLQLPSRAASAARRRGAAQQEQGRHTGDPR